MQGLPVTIGKRLSSGLTRCLAGGLAVHGSKTSFLFGILKKGTMQYASDIAVWLTSNNFWYAAMPCWCACILSGYRWKIATFLWGFTRTAPLGPLLEKKLGKVKILDSSIADFQRSNIDTIRRLPAEQFWSWSVLTSIQAEIPRSFGVFWFDTQAAVWSFLQLNDQA